jgi:autotransporter-associated beta strand protein
LIRPTTFAGTIYGDAGFTYSGGSTLTLSGADTHTDSAAATTSILTVGDSSSTAFSGVIQNGSGTVGLDVVGNGTLTLSGASTYTGPTQINSGTLEVNTNVIPSAVTIGPAGTLQGDGGTGQVTVSFRQACMNRFEACAIVGGQHTTFWRDRRWMAARHAPFPLG